MKKLLSLLSILLLVSCQRNKPQTNTAKDTSAIAPSRLCFQRLEGSSKQDTATVSFLIQDKEVTGSFNTIPHEKDSRIGTIKGQKNGGIIRVLWSFMQEGINDTLTVEFKLSSNKLYQRSLDIDEKTGRQKLTKDSKFSIEYQPINCEY
jgi:hypothetical protein